MLEYEDLIKIKRHDPSEKHKRMSINNRSAQFAAFKSLTGYEDKIKENERVTTKKIILEEERKEQINRIINNISDEFVEIEYFVKDKYKDGGKYITITNKIKRIDYINKKIELINKIKINIDDIINIKIENKPIYE